MVTWTGCGSSDNTSSSAGRDCILAREGRGGATESGVDRSESRPSSSIGSNVLTRLTRIEYRAAALGKRSYYLVRWECDGMSWRALARRMALPILRWDFHVSLV